MDLKDIIKRPLITEKSLVATSLGKYSFAVDPRANKNQIKQAIRRFFKVDPVEIRTMRMKGKARRGMRSHKEVRLGQWKKAIVTLKEGQKIDAFEVTE
ncbi:50S ribosomal protein L23 [Patescibacteria group bacterium]|nr:50S ribosomal protein L23 [Patescibacteria group bacterium]